MYLAGVYEPRQGEAGYGGREEEEEDQTAISAGTAEGINRPTA